MILSDRIPMTIAKGFLTLFGVIFVAIWAVCALGIVAALYRADRAARARSPGPSIVTIGELSRVPVFALMAAVNVIVFAAALVWHRLIGRPLPPVPRPGGRRGP